MPSALHTVNNALDIYAAQKAAVNAMRDELILGLRTSLRWFAKVAADTDGEPAHSHALKQYEVVEAMIKKYEKYECLP